MRWKFAAAVFLLSCSPLFAKSLNWAELIVNARLAADGRMHIQERQAITFDGDWNGGERTFNVPRGQQLDFLGISRIENGREIPLVRGDLAQVDHWDFSGANVVRWRSRLPSDPPFRNRTIVYVLDYVLSGVLDQTPDGHYHLHHDFTFPDRAGNIGYFALTFDIAPVWSGLQSPQRIVRRDLAPGQSVFVDGDLTYAGATKPAAVHIPPTLVDKVIFPLFIAIAGILLTIYFYSAEARKGLFAPLVAQSAIDEQWLQKNVFLLPPEAVGAAWDETIGSHEVAAVIARMVQEKKLTTWITPAEGLAKKPVLNMKLEVDWKTLPADEQKLVEALFLGNTQTDTAMIQQHYRSTGFQPQKLIHDSINATLDSVPVWRESAKAISNGEILTGAFALLSAVLAFLTAGTLQALVFFGGMATIFSLFGAVFVRRSAQSKTTTISIALSWLVMLLFALASFFAVVYEVPAFGGFAAAAGIGFGALILLVSRSRDSVAKLAFRRRLAAARAFFQAQLRQPKPNLRDSWYPYLVALGLGPDVDQWFHAFPNQAAFGGRSSGDFASSSSSSGGWTGGGGAFGGAGASGAWAAMSAVAGGVATPGSSGGGGGGGGSGGGGGGGW